jgi:hypothetical protein
MELARGVGPVLIQAFVSKRTRARMRQGATAELDLAERPWQLDSCHIWAQDGPGVQKLALGWRPFTTVRPVPSVAEMRAGRSDEEG